MILERDMTKQIRRQVKLDKQNWLDSLLDNGNWQAIKAFKAAMKKRKMQSNLKDNSGMDIPVYEKRRKKQYLE